MKDSVNESEIESTGRLGFVRELSPGEISHDQTKLVILPEASKSSMFNNKANMGPTNYPLCVSRQILALTKKNFLLAYRNRTATFLRIFSSCFFILLIFLVNEGLMSRYAAEPYFRDYPSPPSQKIDGIPLCTPKYGMRTCLTFVYCPAPDYGAGFRPDSDYANYSEFTAASNNVSCNAQQCPEMFRVHQIVRKIMATNTIGGRPTPIPATTVLGFMNATAIDTYLSQYQIGQGAYIFAAASETSVTFAVQVASRALYLQLSIRLVSFARSPASAFKEHGINPCSSPKHSDGRQRPNHAAPSRKHAV
jgi:hypothetical protein